MKFVERLLGQRPKGLADLPTAKPVTFESFGSGLVRVPELDVFGHYVKSANERYSLVWRDGHGNIGGSRSENPGHCYIFEEGFLRGQVRVPRPNDCKIANNGTFIINDWTFSTELEGVFLAYNCKGELLHRRVFEANLYNNGLSEDGRFAVTQTASSPKDGSMLTLFGLNEGSEISAWRPESGWARSYQFDTRERILTLSYQADEQFAYSFNGDFLDRPKWLRLRTEKGDLRIIRIVLDESPAPLGNDLRRALFVGLGEAILIAHDDRWLASALRLRGELYEKCEEPKLALEDYERALELDPKIGLKRKTAHLRKSAK